jgi:RNA polymerase sigma-70 factor (ECF subfamily)
MSDTAPEPDDLAQRLTSGDSEALAELFSRHRERLWRMVHFRLDQRLAGRVDPEDILQEAYLDAAQRIGHYRDESPASSFLWLRMIVTQTMIDVHRRHLGAQQRDARREISGNRCFLPQATSMSLASQLLGHLTSPSQAAMRAELSDQLEQAIAKMEPIDQEILALRHFEELTNGEVAEVLGIQVKAASIRYVRALKRLQEILSCLPGFGAELSHA